MEVLRGNLYYGSGKRRKGARGDYRINFTKSLKLLRGDTYREGRGKQQKHPSFFVAREKG